MEFHQHKQPYCNTLSVPHTRLDTAGDRHYSPHQNSLVLEIGHYRKYQILFEGRSSFLKKSFGKIFTYRDSFDPSLVNLHQTVTSREVNVTGRAYCRLERRVMNRDEGGYQLSPIYMRLFTAGNLSGSKPAL
ncbi:hypothetical protein DPMN_170920 [Dreissena polymorpha]|uniref:Uncharacterized protein n=1 Tax=Dreissena polymorpha TaxID=45954 RepID=A0A9D4DZC8_DREPO|nr:hypothetical protein DPMN_170920 [Dreissena polymorpha]